MNLMIHSKNIQMTDALKAYVESKIGSIDDYFDDQKDYIIHVNLSVFKNYHCIEVTIPMGDRIIRAEEKTPDMYQSIDLVEEKLKRQIRKYKTRVNRKNRELKQIDTPEKEFEDKDEIVRIKQYYLKPMNVEEAILQMNLLDHNFFVFKDAETNKMRVVYKRKDKQYGLIISDEVEA